MPIKYVWAARRLLYLQTILKRDNSELTKRVYLAQKANPKKGDFVELVYADAKLVNISMEEEQIENMSKTDFQAIIKSAVRKAAFEHLLLIQQSHSKYKYVKHNTFKMQPYMSDHTMNSDDVALLFALRTKTVRNIRSDFGHMYHSDLCPICKQHVDTIPGLMQCQELLAVPRTGAQHEDIYSPSVDLQRAAVVQFRALLQGRERILDYEETETEDSRRGIVSPKKL